MNDDVETIVRDELAAVAGRVSVDEDWSWSTLNRLGRRRATYRRRQAVAVALAVVAVVFAASMGLRGLRHEAVQPVDRRTPSNGLVDIGGRSLELDCRGSARPGAPTVVIDADISSNVRAYDAVVQRLVDVLRVCTYARAGTGSSDAADSYPRTAWDVADDLARLVVSAGLGPRIVLVTEGFTGLSGAVFAAEHANLVDGLVFLDPHGPDLSAGQAEALGPRRPGEPRLVSDLRRSFSTDAYSGNGEQISLSLSEAEARVVVDASGPAFGATPVVVLWSGAGFDGVPPLPPRMRSAWWAAETAGRDRFSAESTRARVQSVPDATGALPVSDPDAVAKAVIEVAGSADDERG